MFGEKDAWHFARNADYTYIARKENEMRVLLIGTLVTDTLAEFCYDRKVKVSAADIAQKYMLHGLQEIKSVETIDVVGAIRVKPWPKEKVFRFISDEQEILKGKIYGCGYVNIPFVGFWLREFSLLHKVRRWAVEHKGSSDVLVLVYAMSSSGMKAAREVKRIIPKAKVGLCVPDLPLLMKPGGRVRKLAKIIDWHRIQNLMKYVDKYLLYTKYMAEYLGIESQRWLLFEGLIDEKDCGKNTKKG